MIKGKRWSDHYEESCENRPMLEGNIMHHFPFLLEIAKNVKPGYKVLEIGSGTGVLGWPIQQSGIKLVSIDPDDKILEMAKRNAALLGADIEFLPGDARKLPFEDKSFDVAYTHGLIEHFSNKMIHHVIEEQLRVANVIVQGMPLEGNVDGAYGDERFMTPEWWLNHLKKYNILRALCYDEDRMISITIGQEGLR